MKIDQIKDAWTALAYLQETVKVPKGQFNTHGKYKYRSNEDICAAYKPAALAIGCVLTQEDEVIMNGDRHHIQSWTILRHLETGEVVRIHSVAQEASDRKGMDKAQISGACASYARKYSASGMFMIDDTKDSDTMKRPGPEEKVEKVEPKMDPSGTEGALQRNYTAYVASIKNFTTMTAVDGFLKQNAVAIVKDLGGEGSPYLDDFRKDAIDRKIEIAKG